MLNALDKKKSAHIKNVKSLLTMMDLRSSSGELSGVVQNFSVDNFFENEI